MPRVSNNSPTIDEDVQVANATKKRRMFKLLVENVEPAIDVNVFSDHGGRYTGNSPEQAAKKALTQLVRRCTEKENKECSFTFTMAETTSGSARRQFTYIGEVKRLEVPRVVNRTDKNGKTISYEVNYSPSVHSVKKAKETDAEPNIKPKRSRKPKAEPKAEPDVEVKVQKPKAEPKAEPKVKSKRSRKAKPKVEPKVSSDDEVDEE